MHTVFPVFVAAGINFFFEIDFSQPAQPTAHSCPYYTASAGTIKGRLLLKGGYKYREYGTQKQKRGIQTSSLYRQLGVYVASMAYCQPKNKIDYIQINLKFYLVVK